MGQRQGHTIGASGATHLNSAVERAQRHAAVHLFPLCGESSKAANIHQIDLQLGFIVLEM
jgi:hypothetical protein